MSGVKKKKREEKSRYEMKERRQRRKMGQSVEKRIEERKLRGSENISCLLRACVLVKER